MKSTFKNHGPFIVKSKAIRAVLKFGPATLTCEVQKGQTPLGRNYRMAPKWWIKFDKDPCASGPWSADAVRKHYTGETPKS